MNLKLTEKSIQNLDYIMSECDIDSKAQGIRTAINFYAKSIMKENAKINMYNKKPKNKNHI